MGDRDSFRRAVEARDIEAMDLIRFGPSDRISDFTVMVRPRSALEALLAEVRSRLAAGAAASERAE